MYCCCSFLATYQYGFESQTVGSMKNIKQYKVIAIQGYHIPKGLVCRVLPTKQCHTKNSRFNFQQFRAHRFANVFRKNPAFPGTLCFHKQVTLAGEHAPTFSTWSCETHFTLKIRRLSVTYRKVLQEINSPSPRWLQITFYRAPYVLLESYIPFYYRIIHFCFCTDWRRKSYGELFILHDVNCICIWPNFKLDWCYNNRVRSSNNHIGSFSLKNNRKRLRLP